MLVTETSNENTHRFAFVHYDAKRVRPTRHMLMMEPIGPESSSYAMSTWLLRKLN